MPPTDEQPDPLPPQESLDASPDEGGELSSEPSTKPEQTAGFSGWFRRSFNPFRIATLRGLAIVLPPLLTIIVFLWIWGTLESAILQPLESLAARVIVWGIDHTYTDAEIQQMVNEDLPDTGFERIDDMAVYKTTDGQQYVKVKSNWIPRKVYLVAHDNPGDRPLNTAHDYYYQYAQLVFLKRRYTIPAFLACFLALMYLLGKLLAVGMGRFFYHRAEAIIHRLPVIRNVYSSVKQVTDFAFSENEVQFNRVVAVEYPRRGIWAVGFVTGDGMIDVANAAEESIVSVLMPTSPMPMTGFTIMVPKSQTIDLDVTIDQAIQFCVSCGVVVPDQQMTPAALEARVRQRASNNSNSSIT